MRCSSRYAPPPLLPRRRRTRERRRHPRDEVAGVIHTLGPDVRGDWTPGQPVVLQAGQACGECEDCVRRRSTCQRPLTRGVDHDGGWAQMVTATADESASTIGR
ncbi:alcohol dehydrogenase catalytic domain-containing protein [Streptomyces sp. NPDC101171]|uniref:alcohol dehydrogenase catalytic domain-containing protein n=1 Tax=Streptomyces sp. NPDC101171 TaxID=3366122 RepID=UPI003828435E